MKSLLLLVVASSVSAASILPASNVLTANRLQPIETRIADRIQFAASNGFHYTEVDMDGVSFKEEKALMKMLESQGYKVEFANDHHVYGWNSLNGGLLIHWK